MARRQRTLEERLWSKVDKSGDCWLWTGPRSEGYGVVNINGRHLRAHRLIYEAVVGAIPPGMFVCHSCDNPPCVNPAHLWVGSARANNRDSTDKGRHFLGQRTHCRHGHEFTAENTRLLHGVRLCRICKRADRRAYKIRIRLAKRAEQEATSVGQ